MDLYELPKFNLPKFKFPKLFKSKIFWFIISTIFISSLFGFLAGLVSGSYFYLEIKDYLSNINIELPGVTKVIEKEYIPQTTQEQAIIEAVKDYSPAVVSIVVTKDVPIIEQYYYNPFEEFEQFFGQPFQFQIPQYQQKGTQKQEVGGGSGFLVSKEGMVVTNKHVVLDEEAEYTVFTNDGKSYPAEVLAKDPFQDLAILKIDQEKIVDEQGDFILSSFPVVKLGDSDSLQMGQIVIAIGNVLGEFRNSVSVGVVSGLGRTITAEGGGFVETIEDVIQTDAAINRGNSGGPLLNLKGEVVGINTAMIQEAQSIGFAIPINKAKRDIDQVKKIGKIVYPFLGIRYVPITEKVKEDNNLPVSYGAWIIQGSSEEPAVYPDSAAEKAGLQEGDIILEFDGEKITAENTLTKMIQKHEPGDEVVLKILKDGEEKEITAILEERSE
jgi:serine protease Do